MLLSNLLQLEQVKPPLKHSINIQGKKRRNNQEPKSSEAFPTRLSAWLLGFQSGCCSFLSHLRRTNYTDWPWKFIFLAELHQILHIWIKRQVTHLWVLLVTDSISAQTLVALAGTQTNFRDMQCTFQRLSLKSIQKIKLTAGKIQWVRASAPATRAFIRKRNPAWLNVHKCGDLDPDFHIQV